MRIMLQFTIPVEKGNEAVADGSISQAIKDLVNKTQAESAYFYLRNGKRCGMVVFEETDAARFAAINGGERGTLVTKYTKSPESIGGRLHRSAPHRIPMPWPVRCEPVCIITEIADN